MIRKTHRCLLKSVNWVLAGILSMLGFSGCEIKKVGPEEYGTPHATLSLHGKVTGKDGKPVENINVKLSEPIYVDSVSTDAAGGYSFTLDVYSIDEFNVIASDIDGELNGSYQSDTVRVKITEEDYYDKGDGKWNNGSADKEVDIELKEKE
jgi:putative lipoprotein (rSAM/lipoprotein system)